MSRSWVLPIWLLAAGAVIVLGAGTPPARLGQSCLNEGQCSRSVANSTCSSGTCSCKPYYAEYEGSCLPSTLLGLPCRVDGQCRLKVANSSCLKGTCDCDGGFLRFRRHTCLPPAHLGEICYSDAHCRLADSQLYCDFIIRNLLGRCRCHRLTPAGHDHSQGPCTLHNTLPGEEAVTEPLSSSPASISSTQVSSLSSEISSTSTTASIFTQPPFEPTKTIFPETSPSTTASVTSSVLTASTTPLTTLPTKDNVISDMFPLSTIMSPTPNNTLESWHSEQSDIETTTRRDSLKFTTTTTKDFMDEISNTIVDHHYQDKEALRRKGEGVLAVSLGWFCQSDSQCQAADPESRCIQGICDCRLNQKNSSECRARRTGCHPSTFQCRSNGQCISWFFVCDGQRDCPDGSDEACSPSEGCPGPKGMAFRCSNGKCITRAARCDGRHDCEGGEDEHGCLPHGNKRIGCPGKAFQCQDGQCLPEYEFCNAIIGCKDGSDELSTVCGSPFHFKVTRINTRKAREEDTCPFRCRNGRCRSTAIVCSGRDGCGDNSDENRCQVCRCRAT